MLRFDPFFLDKFFHFFPGDVFCHAVGRGTVKVGFAWSVYCCFEEFDAGEVGFSEASASYEDSESFVAVEYFPLCPTEG